MSHKLSAKAELIYTQTTIVNSKIKAFHHELDEKIHECIGKTVPCTPTLIGWLIINQNYSKLSKAEKLAVFDGQEVARSRDLLEEVAL